MALVADPARLAGTSETEALCRLLRKPVAEEERDKRRAGFRALADRLITKAEMDELWEME